MEEFDKKNKSESDVIQEIKKDGQSSIEETFNSPVAIINKLLWEYELREIIKKLNEPWDEFSWLDWGIFKKLISAGILHSAYEYDWFNWNALSKFKWLDIEHAELMIDAGKFDVVIKNINLFNWIDKKSFIHRAINTWFWREVISSIAYFNFLNETDIFEIVDLLIGSKQWWCIISYIDDIEMDDGIIIDKLLDNWLRYSTARRVHKFIINEQKQKDVLKRYLDSGNIKSVLSYITNFKIEDHNLFAKKAINAWETHTLIQNLKHLKGLDQEVFDIIQKEKNSLSYMFNHVDSFNSLDHTELAENAIKLEGAECLQYKIKKLKWLSNNIAQQLMDGPTSEEINGRRHYLDLKKEVYNNLSSFDKLDQKIFDAIFDLWETQKLVKNLASFEIDHNYVVEKILKLDEWKILINSFIKNFHWLNDETLKLLSSQWIETDIQYDKIDKASESKETVAWLNIIICRRYWSDETNDMAEIQKKLPDILGKIKYTHNIDEVKSLLDPNKKNIIFLWQHFDGMKKWLDISAEIKELWLDTNISLVTSESLSRDSIKSRCDKYIEINKEFNQNDWSIKIAWHIERMIKDISVA